MPQCFIQIKGIKKRYGTTPVLKGIDLDIFQGEILTLLGVNGAGKTTLSSIIATLHPPTEGDIIFDGTSIYKRITEFRRKLGFCPQKPNLNGMLTLEDNLRSDGALYGMAPAAIDERIGQLCKQFELDRYLNEKASMLSGGYKQRFMIARTLMHRPSFIILDEPTVGLDPHIRRNLWDIIKGLKQQGITVLLTTHYLDEAEKLSDRVCILDKGQIRLIDTPDKLMADFQQKNLEDVFIGLMETAKQEHE
jgi:ABC-2 type transport system ATP-binding protein